MPHAFLAATALVLLAAAQTLATPAPEPGSALPAAAVPAARAALASVLAKDDTFSGCSATDRRAALAQAELRKLGSLDGDDVVLAEVQNTCICGAQNCPYYIVRATPARPQLLLSTFGVTLTTQAASPLPRIVVRTHDSAAVAEETAYAYRGGTYATLGSERVRWADNARKPNLIPVRFGAGSSSARVHGSVSMGWYDEYVFAAARGQKLVVDGMRATARLRLNVYDPSSAYDLKPGVPYTLPHTATYRLHVEPATADGDVPYAFTLTIR